MLHCITLNNLSHNHNLYLYLLLFIIKWQLVHTVYSGPGKHTITPNLVFSMPFYFQVKSLYRTERQTDERDQQCIAAVNVGCLEDSRIDIIQVTWRFDQLLTSAELHDHSTFRHTGTFLLLHTNINVTLFNSGGRKSIEYVRAVIFYQMQLRDMKV